MPWPLWGQSETSRSFNVMIYEEDYKELCAWVLKKPNIETGGDLFGLWADKHTAVIQLVLGPGQGCRRTSVSFYQDIHYLQRVGSFLTQNEGVCHIGEWHSHHQLGLARPSGGDENTVWNNMPTYNLKRFVIFIANIRSSKQNYSVNIGCFLFETDDQGNHLDVLPGEFTILQNKNPLSLKKEVSKKINQGAEKDDEIIKDLKLEMKERGKSPKSVTCAAPHKKRKGEQNNQPQTKAKPANDEESSGETKKQKMDTEASPPVTPKENTIPESGKVSSDGSLTNEDMRNLTINDTQRDEQPEVAMEVEDEKKQPEKNDKEEKRDDEQKNSIVNIQNEVSDRESEKEKLKGEENGKEMKENKETSSPGVVQQQPQKNASDKENPSSPLEKDATSAKQTEQQPLQVEEKAETKAEQSSGEEAEKKIDTKQSSPHVPRPLPKLTEENKSEKKTGPQPLQDEEEAKTKAEQSSGEEAEKKIDTKQSLPHGPRPLPKLPEEDKSEKKTGPQPLQDEEEAKTKAEQSSGKKKATATKRPDQQSSDKNAKTGKK